MTNILNYLNFSSKIKCLPIYIKGDNDLSQEIQEYFFKKGIYFITGSKKLINNYSQYIVLTIEPNNKYIAFFDVISEIKKIYNYAEILNSVSPDEVLNGKIDYLIEANNLGLM